MLARAKAHCPCCVSSECANPDWLFFYLHNGCLLPFANMSPWLYSFERNSIVKFKYNFYRNRNNGLVVVFYEKLFKKIQWTEAKFVSILVYTRTVSFSCGIHSKPVNGASRLGVTQRSWQLLSRSSVTIRDTISALRERTITRYTRNTKRSGHTASCVALLTVSNVNLCA